NAQKVLPRMIAVIGTSGVGKTVYLGMLLDILSRQPQRMQVLARGAFSITLQQTVISALARGEFPTKTPNEPDRWNWVHCQIRTDAGRAWHERPLALVLSKADRCETCFDDPAKYAERSATGLWEHCRERFPHHQFFAAGVAGACVTHFIRGAGRVVAPLRIE